MSTHPTNGRREVTVTEVAAAAKVSKATAARALGGYGAVSETVRDRVLTAADELGYRPNALAKSMNTGRSNTIGLVVGDIENPFFAHATRGAWDVARAAGYDLIVSNSDEELGAESDAISVLLDKRVDGILVSPASSIETQTLQTVLDLGRPLVLFDRSVPALSESVDAVVADNEAGAFELAGLLLAAGHRRIAFISTIAHEGDYEHGDQIGSTSVGDRVAGLLRATDAVSAAEKATAPKATVAPVASQSLEALAAPELAIRLNARRDGIDAVTRAVLTGPDRVTAIIASDSLVALAVFRTVRELGLTIPRDVSLVSFDDADWTSLTTPAITVMAQPIYEVGAEAARLLLRRITGDGAPAAVTSLPQHLVERDSVGAPARLSG